MAQNKQTSTKVASVAGRILRSKKHDKDSKSIAGSALTQTKPSKKKVTGQVRQFGASSIVW